MQQSKMSWFDRWKQRARQLKYETYTLYLAYHDPRVPWYAKVAAVLVVAYAFSPIDLIPDFIPILGYLDDLLIVPLGIALVIRLIPADILEEKRQLAREHLGKDRPQNWIAGAIIIIIWVAVILWLGSLAYRYWKR